jgi:hypothetical protein
MSYVCQVECNAKFGGLEGNNEGGVGMYTDSTYMLKNHFKNYKIFNEMLTFLIRHSLTPRGTSSLHAKLGGIWTNNEGGGVKYTE